MYKVVPVKLVTPMAPLELERALPPEPIPPKPPEMYIPEETHIFDKPNFLPKPIPHSAKISPSSIPNPSPSVTTSKHMEPGYPNYSTRLYSIPGYSAFQPVSYSRKEQPSQPPPPLPVEVQAPEFNPYPTLPRDNHVPPAVEEKCMDTEQPVRLVQQQETPKIQTDFEEHFTPEIIPAASVSDVPKIQNTESKMSITSLAQGSGATITIPSQIQHNEVKKKPEQQRYSLKTSIPISKLDMKCVSNPPDSAYQNSLAKKPFNPAFSKEAPRVEIQSNIVIKTATKEHEVKETKPGVPSNSISTLINAAEAIHKTESSQHQFRVPEPKVDPPAEVKEPPPLPRPIFNPMNIETSKVHLNKPPEPTYNEQKNQIVFIQNKNNPNPKMLVTIQQQSPQVLVQRSSFDSKNPPPPSRLTNQSKKCKEDAVNESTSSKVVALKKLHHENCDEDDFENLITENQIYGNKIVVKEKSQGTSQEQDLKNKKAADKVTPQETKNVVLQPNFLYLSNVPFPGNLMMIKNNSKVPQNTESNKTKVTPTENKVQNEIPITPSTDTCIDNKTSKPIAASASKEIHVFKSNNNTVQTVANKTKPDIVIQANQKVIVSPQIVYQVPIVSTVVEADKPKPPQVCSDFSKFVTPKKKYSKQFEQAKANEKPLFIACPYQMDSNLQPKIVITNIRPKVNKVDEVSALDIYEQRKRMRRLKYLCKRDKDVKAEAKKVEKSDLPNVITPDKVKNEVYKEFANTKVGAEDASSGSDTDDYGEEELKTYEDIIEEYGANGSSEKKKVDFMATLQLATLKAYKAKGQELQDKVLKNDSVAAAYAAVGRLDQLLNVKTGPDDEGSPSGEAADDVSEEAVSGQRKQQFLSRLQLTQVSQQYKDDYEKAWNEVLKERKRRNNTDSDVNAKHPRVSAGSLGFDPNCQLRLLTEIKKCVNDNNNLIKKRLDQVNADINDESIPVLAEKNFSELNRLSKMADRSLKLFKVPNTRKRDLNPGFDSENIKKPAPQSVKVDQPYQNYPKIKIPNFSKIISLKSTQECEAVTSTPATSMDEPQNSAAGVTEMFLEPAPGRTRDVSCQVEEPTWPDIENLMKSYKTFEAGRRREISDLRKRNTSLRVEGAHITRSASRDSDRSRALLAERQHLAVEENNLRMSLQRLRQAIEVIRNS